MLGKAIRDSWPLFFGILLLMLANGLLVTLLTVRGTALGFTSIQLGIMQSGYPVGALFGCVIAPRILARVGHARAFGALASLCSVAALVHIVTSDVVSWTAMRGLAGFCFPGLYVVSESWLNAQATNRTRATLLSVYFVVQVAGAALGQLLLNIPDEGGAILFVITSALVSLSLVPMLLSNVQAGSFEEPERITLPELVRISPFGFIGCLLNGVAQSMLYVGIGILAASLALEDGIIGTLIAMIALGGALTQFPLGALSDRVDRRLVAAACALFSLLPAIYLMVSLEPGEVDFSVFVAVAVLGGTVIPIYSLCVAQTNDRLRSEQIIPAAGALVLVLNLGIVFGPIIGSTAISLFGAEGFLAALMVVQGTTALSGLFRWRGGPKEVEDRPAAAPLSSTATGTAQQLNPEAPDTTGSS